jgi:uncharacterized membrane protein
MRLNSPPFNSHKIMATNKTTAKKRAKKPVSIGSSMSLDTETRSNTRKVAELEKTQKLNRTIGEKIAEVIAAFCGSMVFVYVHVIWFAAWVLLNSVLSFGQFDPFPYTFLTLVVSLEAIFLSTFILISQNHETQLTERRNHLDLQINMIAEQENTKMLELLQLIAVKVGVPHKDPSADALLESVEPGRLIEQIMSAKGEDPKQAEPRFK